MSILKQWKDEARLSEEAFARLSLFRDLILEWNPRINLTGFKDAHQIEEVLIGEAVLASREVSLEGKTVLDFGSGAGVPGLIWGMTVPGIVLTSLEVRQKKVAFQKEVLRSTGIQAEIVCGLFPGAVSDRTFDVIATRAVRISPGLYRDAVRLLSPGGLLLRFARSGAIESGWTSIPLSTRSSLLVRHVTGNA